MKKISLCFFFLFFLCPTIILAENKKVEVSFSKCVDGDTAKFILQEKEITVRFLAIDTPETKHPTKGEEPYGKEASDYTCNALKKATTITLEYDSESDTYDKYNRHLAWVYVDHVLLQDLLVQKGLAKVAYLYGDYAYTKQLQRSEAIAKEQQLGVWNNEVSKDDSYWYLIIFLFFVIIIYILYPKSRKKIHKKIKSQIKKTVKKRNFIS